MPNQREQAKEEANEALTCIVTYVMPALAVVATRSAIGALDGAIGFGLMRTTQNWTAPGYTISNIIASQAIGAAILSPVSMPILAFALVVIMDEPAADTNDQTNMCSVKSLMAGTITSTALNAFFGMFDGLVGAAVLDLLPPGSVELNTSPQSDFATAVGASGGAVTALGIFGTLLLLRIAYLLYAVSDCTCKNNNQTMLSQFFSKRANATPVRAEAANGQHVSSQSSSQSSRMTVV